MCETKIRHTSPEHAIFFEYSFIVFFLFFLFPHSGSMKSDGSNASSTNSATTHNVLNNLAGFGLLDTAQEVQSPLTASVAPKVREYLLCFIYYLCVLLVNKDARLWTIAADCHRFFFIPCSIFILPSFFTCCSLLRCASPLLRPLPIQTLTLWLNPLSWAAGPPASTIPGTGMLVISFVFFHMRFSFFITILPTLS